MENEKYLYSWSNELYLLDKGVRSCCTDTIGGDSEEDLTETLRKLEQMTLRHGARFLSFKTKPDKNNSYTIYAYKYSHQAPLIQILESYKGSKYVYDYVKGKLLGYSDAAMEDYLSHRILGQVKLDPSEVK